MKPSGHRVIAIQLSVTMIGANLVALHLNQDLSGKGPKCKASDRFAGSDVYRDAASQDGLVYWGPFTNRDLVRLRHG